MSLDKDFYNIGEWLPRKMQFHENSNYRRVKSKIIVKYEIWLADLGFNIGDEKNKQRPVLIISNNKINNSAKVIVACITDAKGKILQNGKPKFDSWHLLYTNSTRNNDKYMIGRFIPMNIKPYLSFVLRKDSVVQLEETRAISKVRLIKKLGALNTDDIILIKDAIKRVFDI